MQVILAAQGFLQADLDKSNRVTAQPDNKIARWLAFSLDSSNAEIMPMAWSARCQLSGLVEKNFPFTFPGQPRQYLLWQHGKQL